MADRETREERARRIRIQRIILVVALAVIVLCAAAGLAWGLYQKSQRTKQSGVQCAPTLEATTTASPSKPATPTTGVPPTSKALASMDVKEVPAPKSGSLAGKVIAIDPGHQGHADSSPEPIGPGASKTKPKVAGGTSGVVTGIPESQTVLEIGLKLKAALEAQGATVVMTRTSQNANVSNSERAAVANGAGADLFIRLHCDGAASSSPQGISMLVPADNSWTAPIFSSSRSAGEALQAAVIAATGAKNNGVVQRSDLSGFNYCKVPSVLIEMGFMTNADEDRALNSADYQDKLVAGLTQGCITWLK
ncbi:MAG: N-acetylmuramoyl-L-alanine amidase [Actinomycetia bacterium]|nr:N-acetylmuramoyl-L-alanine amidase [Actinomycetes bacterium]